ncbi:MAG: hypothetical protein JST42_18480 [Bacteroidetes bacterium]|nr:hypothetical protein [Bacteroidota bacterium]
MAEATGRQFGWSYSGAGRLSSELLHKFRAEQEGVQTQFVRFLLRQPGGVGVYIVDNYDIIIVF